jgi:glycosyltransferase involved in cell wall biosynthesis
MRIRMISKCLPSPQSLPGILYVIRSLEKGGTENQVVTLLRHLHRKTHLCHVFALEPGGRLQGVLNDLGVSVYSGDLKHTDFYRAPWKLLLSQLKLISVLRRIRPQVVHSFLPLATFMGALAGRVTNVPSIITARRALATHQERYAVLKPLDRIANALSHRVTVNSKAVWEDTVRRDHIDPSKLTLIYNGVDSAPFESARSQRAAVRRQLGIKNHEPVIIAVANLIPYKGHADLIRAAKQVIAAIPESRFLLVGEDRGIQKELEGQVKAMGISERMMFLGHRNDIPQLLAASDLYILASHEEGFSNVVLESMAAGLPVVATDVGGNREAVLDGVTGWLVPPKDPETMAEKIILTLDGLAGAKIQGDQGRLRVKQFFTVEQMIDAHVKLYGSN